MHHEPVLIPDITLLIQLGVFFASYFVLNQLVFKPYLALLKARREMTVGLREQAAVDREQSERLRQQCEAFLKTERKKIGAWVEDERKKVQEEETEKIRHARDAAAKANESARAALEQEKAAARKNLEKSVTEFSSAIASKMLGRNIEVSSVSPPKKRDPESTVSG